MKLREGSLTALLGITHPVADVGEDADVGVEGVRGDQGEAVGLLPVYQHSLHTAQSGGGMIDSALIVVSPYLCHTDREEPEPYFIEKSRAKDLLHTQTWQLRGRHYGRGRGCVLESVGTLRHQAEADYAEDSQYPAQQQETVGNAAAE